MKSVLQNHRGRLKLSDGLVVIGKFIKKVSASCFNRLQMQGQALGFNAQEQVDVGVFAGIGFGIGNMFGKQGEAAFGGFAVEYAAGFLRQRVIKLERSELAGGGGDMVQGFAVFAVDVQAA